MAGITTVRVLVVDDDPEFVTLIRDMLGDATRATFIVDDEASLVKGIAAVEKGRYDVILLDYKLPDGDGFLFLEKLEHSHIKVPVVVVTGHGDKAIQVRSLEAGAVEYLGKGTFNAELLERTCIYAIGMQEKRNRNGSGPGVGVLIEQLVDLTRDSVKAQTQATSEIQEMRKDMSIGFAAVKTDISNSLMATEMTLKTKRDFCKFEHDRVVTEVQSLFWGRWVLEWIKANTTLSIILFVCILLAVAMAVILLSFVDTQKVKDLVGVTSSITPPLLGWPKWMV